MSGADGVIRVLVAEDTAILRDTLVAVLNLQDDLEVVAEAGTGGEIVATALRHRPDVAVVDVELPGTDGVTAAAALRERLPTCRVLILTEYARPETLRRALAAEVAGFVLKDTPAAGLVTAIRRVAAGERVIDPGLAVATVRAPTNPLTPRETEVLKHYAQGGDPRDIATALHLSHGTVRNYLASAMIKLDARNRIDAIRIATAAGWL